MPMTKKQQQFKVEIEEEVWDGKEGATTSFNFSVSDFDFDHFGDEEEWGGCNDLVDFSIFLGSCSTRWIFHIAKRYQKHFNPKQQQDRCGIEAE